jgi:hypothetical protein
VVLYDTAPRHGDEATPPNPMALHSLDLTGVRVLDGSEVAGFVETIAALPWDQDGGVLKVAVADPLVADVVGSALRAKLGEGMLELLLEADSKVAV